MKTIIANFKSQKTPEEYLSWMDHFEQYAASLSDQLRIVLAPPYPDLSFFASRLADHRVHPRTELAIQDLSPFPAGAYTGAVGTQVLSGFPIRVAIVGHSERRRYFHETDLDIANKVTEALAADIVPVLCVTRDQLASQATKIDTAARSRIMVAYEPIEHIGTGTTDTLDHIIETRRQVHEAFGSVPYIYGGSVNEQTDSEILQHPEIDGFLVGSACLDPDQFRDFLLKLAS